MGTEGNHSLVIFPQNGGDVVEVGYIRMLKFENVWVWFTVKCPNTSGWRDWFYQSCGTFQKTWGRWLDRWSHMQSTTMTWQKCHDTGSIHCSFEALSMLSTLEMLRSWHLFHFWKKIPNSFHYINLLTYLKGVFKKQSNIYYFLFDPGCLYTHRAMNQGRIANQTNIYIVCESSTDLKQSHFRFQVR